MTDSPMMPHINQFPSESRAVASISGKLKEVRAESMTATKEGIPDGPAQRIVAWYII
jgi:hypothetical protein